MGRIRDGISPARKEKMNNKQEKEQNKTNEKGAMFFLVQKDGSNKTVYEAEVLNMFGKDFVEKILDAGSAINGVGTYYARKGLAR